MYGAVGTGNVKEGIVTISLGTSGTAYTFLKKPYVDPTGEIAGFCDSTGHYLPLLCVSNLANGYNEILKLYNLSHQDFTEIIRKSPVGNNGRMIAPWYVGERTPDVPNGTPVYFGFALNDLNQKEVVCRGVLEGHLFNLYDGFKRMPVNPSEIRLTGGISRSGSGAKPLPIFLMPKRSLLKVKAQPWARPFMRSGCIRWNREIPSHLKKWLTSY